MGRRRKFHEFAPVVGPVMDNERETAAARWGFAEQVTITLPKGFSQAGSIIAEMKVWLPRNTIDDYLYLTRQVEINRSDSQTDQMVYCFRNHRDAINFKVRWG